LTVTEDDPAARVAEVVAAAAAREDPSLPGDVGRELATSALAELRMHPSVTPGALARALLEQHPRADASWVNHVARLTVLLVTRR
jgi:hypothetical protein